MDVVVAQALVAGGTSGVVAFVVWRVLALASSHWLEARRLQLQGVAEENRHKERMRELEIVDSKAATPEAAIQMNRVVAGPWTQTDRELSPVGGGHEALPGPDR